MREPTTAVIGAGISGLTAGKMLDDYGVPYTCFESSDRVGGNWAFGNPNGHSSAYRSLHIDTSKHQLSFKDFPMPEDYPDFPHHTQIKAYLDAYADAFGLREHIEFGNGVEHARRLARRRLGDRRPGRRAPAASTCSSSPTATTGTRGCADFPGEFTGETIHSHHYIDPTTPLDLTGKRILVVGLGNSAADIAVELSSKSLRNKVTLSTRSSAWIVPKYVGGLPADKYFATSPHLPLHWQRWLRPEDAVHDRLQPGALRPAGAQPQVLRGAPDPVGRAAAAARVRRRHAEGQRRPARRRRPCTSRTAPATTST